MENNWLWCNTNRESIIYLKKNGFEFASEESIWKSHSINFLTPLIIGSYKLKSSEK